jgi:hypothetical protein
MATQPLPPERYLELLQADAVALAGLRALLVRATQ